jgi:phage FluMu protein Com
MQAIVVEAEIKCPKCGLLQKISCTEAPKHVSMFSSSTKGMVATAI